MQRPHDECGFRRNCASAQLRKIGDFLRTIGKLVSNGVRIALEVSEVGSLNFRFLPQALGRDNEYGERTNSSNQHRYKSPDRRRDPL